MNSGIPVVSKGLDKRVSKSMTIFFSKLSGKYFEDIFCEKVFARLCFCPEATLHNVTHKPCHLARYTPIAGKNNYSPSNADQSKFKIAPGSVMPDIPGCYGLDYAVLIVIGRVDHVASK